MHPDLDSWEPDSAAEPDRCENCGAPPWEWEPAPGGRVVCGCCGREQEVSDPGPDDYTGEDDATWQAAANLYGATEDPER